MISSSCNLTREMIENQTHAFLNFETKSFYCRISINAIKEFNPQNCTFEKRLNYVSYNPTWNELIHSHNSMMKISGI